MTEGVFDDLDRARPVNRRKIKAHRGKLPLGRLAKIFRGRLDNAAGLRGAQPGHGKINRRGLFDLAEHVILCVAQDKVDFAALPAPTTVQDRHAARGVGADHASFGGLSRKVGALAFFPTLLCDRGLGIITHILCHCPAPLRANTLIVSRQLQRALIDLPPGQAKFGRHRIGGVAHRQPLKRLAKG